MPRRTHLLAAALLTAGALVLTACASESATEPTPTGTPDSAASVSIRVTLEPSNLDILQTPGVALDQILIDNVYQGLVTRTTDQKIESALASDWTVSDDGLTYEFTLREGVVFHDGQELTPQDVVWSLTTRRDTETWRDSARLANVTGIAAEGQTITLSLAEPDSALLWNLTGRAGIIVKEGDTVDYATAANGTGPFVLDDWKEGDSVTLSRFEDYWGDKAQVSEVVFAVIPEDQAALNAAAAGEVDVLTGFSGTLAEQIEADGAFTVQRGTSTDKYVLAMNSAAAPLDDIKVREAIRMAIDRDSIVEAVAQGTPMYGPIPEPDPGYEDLSDVVTFDPEGAKALLKEADAEDLTLTLTTPSFYPPTVPQVLVSQLNEVGITLMVTPVDFGVWLEDVYTNKDYQLSLVDHSEARDFENWANPDYYFNYDNAKVQELYADSLSEQDPEKSADLLAQAAKIVSEDMAADWLYNWDSLVATSADISGMPTDNVNARINLAELAKSDG